jgi:two-component system NarL family sensor kinase
VCSSDLRERNRLARELHDGLTQIMVATQIYLHLLGKSLESTDPNILAILQKVQSLNKLGLEESRFILSELKGKPITPLQFRERVDGIINLFATPDQEIEFDYKVNVKEIPYQVYQTVLKILQETLSNIQKHAQAQKVKIYIINSTQQMIFSIEDDGVGFDPQILEEKESDHFGLKNLKERVRVLRGKFDIDSQPGWGTKIMVKVPLPREIMV